MRLEKSESNTLLSIVVPVFTTKERFALSKDFFSQCEQYPVEFVFVVTSIDCDEEFITIASGENKKKIIQSLDSDPGVARNEGIKQASGEWIVFWDPDDKPNISAVIELISKGSDEKSRMIVGQYEIENESGGLITESRMQMHLDSKFARNAGLWRCIFKNDLAASISFRSLRMAEDQIYLCEFDLDSVNILFSNKVIYKYIKYQSGQLTKSKKALQDIPTAITITKKIIDEKGQSIFRLTCIYSQVITGLRRGSIQTKFNTLKMLFKITYGFKGLGLKSSFFGILNCLMIGK
jgi:glycosyltransferase involved in cell wall biosynthesis